jgi:hypothetical protein
LAAQVVHCIRVAPADGPKRDVRCVGHDADRLSARFRSVYFGGPAFPGARCTTPSIEPASIAALGRRSTSVSG